MPERPLATEKTDSNRNATSNPPASGRERIKHLLIGSRKTVRATINTLHVKGYAEAREWSKPQLAGILGESGEVVSVLIRYMSPE